jgi:hypothetical protein
MHFLITRYIIKEEEFVVSGMLTPALNIKLILGQ